MPLITVPELSHQDIHDVKVMTKAGSVTYCLKLTTMDTEMQSPPQCQRCVVTVTELKTEVVGSCSSTQGHSVFVQGLGICHLKMLNLPQLTV